MKYHKLSIRFMKSMCVLYLLIVVTVILLPFIYGGVDIFHFYGY